MINPNTLKPFGKFCITLGMIPSSYKASLSYEEQLFWFCDYLENKVIPAINNNAEALQEVQALYEEIRQFVIDYFSTLDVQDEIDNKLDEMTEDGTLAEIINQQIFDSLNTRVTNLENNKISSVFGVAPFENNEDWHPFYIDAENGNDENSGSQLEPFASFNPILHLINNGKLKIEIVLKRGQTFVLPTFVFNACTLHFSVYGDGADNAIITRNVLPSVNSSLVFYNCHVNANNITFTNIGYDMYSDGGSFVATNCIFDCKYTTWSAGVRMNNCVIKTLKSRMANLWIQNENTRIGCIDSQASNFTFYRPTFVPSFAINDENNAGCFSFVGGTVAIYGVASVDNTNEARYQRLFHFTNSIVTLSSALTTTVTSVYTQHSVFSCSKLIATLNRVNALDSACNGLDFIEGSEYPTE